jgi:uncharacterized protein YndB with AHSA1/START domain
MTKTETKPGTRIIRRELEIDAPIEDVWRAITEASEIKRWFAPEAESTPGPVIGDEGGGGTEALAGTEPSSSALRIVYTLEPIATGTRLRLVHSGFGPSAAWDEIYDGTSKGWTYELRALKHYLEHHKGELRRLVRAAAVISMPVADAWRRLFSPEALGLVNADPDTLAEGDAFEAVAATGDRFTGRVVMRSGPSLGVSIDQFNNALLRVVVEKWFEKGNNYEAMVWLSAHNVDREIVEAFERRWNETLAKVFAA